MNLRCFMFLRRLIMSVGVIIFLALSSVIQGLNLDPCTDGVFEVVDNAVNTITCYDKDYSSKTSYTWYWTFTPNRGTSFQIGNCTLSNGLIWTSFSCDKGEPSMFALTTGKNATVLTINTKKYKRERINDGKSRFGNSTISCAQQQKTDSCTTDFVHPVLDAACSVTFSTAASPWRVVIHCDVSKMFSAMGRYACQFFLAKGREPDTKIGSKIMTTTSIEGESDVRGWCNMTSSLPTSDGVYNLSAVITPGRNRFQANFTSTNHIRKPYAATLTDNCPSTVTEGDDVNCTCATTDVGSPEGTLRWVGSDTDHMSLFNVTRADNVKAFTCELMWNGELMNSLTYILNVFWPPATSPTHNCTDFVTEGSDVVCECVTNDVSNPLASLEWESTNSSFLWISDVKHSDAGRRFTCQMTWNGQLKGSTSYEIAVIRKPSSPLNYTCPAYVIKGSNLDCSCITNDFGFPLATLQWTVTNSSQLIRHNVHLDDAGTTFTCQLVWNESTVASLTYTLHVAVDAESLEKARLRWLGAGLACGLAVGLVLVLVLVVVFVLWRCGLVRPCSSASVVKRNKDKDGGSRTQAASNIEEPRASNAETQNTQAKGVLSGYEMCDIGPTEAETPPPKTRAQTKPKRTKKQGTRTPTGHQNPAFVSEDDGIIYENGPMQRRF
ncbi:uncharacterized protein [Littorina saxatilis]|uniref:uncharacterized protein n=1 Tax=Littorina saxatilis TaxID=31220 RepID=UPI0038B4F5E0